VHLTHFEVPGDENQDRSGRTRRLVAGEGLRPAPFEISLAGGRYTWREVARSYFAICAGIAAGVVLAIQALTTGTLSGSCSSDRGA
jgi:hypothetical protein